MTSEDEDRGSDVLTAVASGTQIKPVVRQTVHLQQLQAVAKSPNLKTSVRQTVLLQRLKAVSMSTTRRWRWPTTNERRIDNPITTERSEDTEQSLTYTSPLSHVQSVDAKFLTELNQDKLFIKSTVGVDENESPCQ